MIRELNSERPLLPRNWQPSAETREVLETCQVIAEAPQGSIAAYVISMAKTPSDVLAVDLPPRSGYRVCDAGCSAV
ncbi:phosphoenolpyruvate carboxylase [Shigella flexneri]